MYGMMDIELAKERRRELIEEAEGMRLARIAGAAGAEKRVGTGIGVRWGMAADEEAVADLLQLNGMPRWVAFEERFIVAEKDERLLGAVRYRTESKRLLLGLLVVDPWEGERRTARALYSGAVGLARDLGASEVLAESVTGADYPGEAGYWRAGRGWRIPVSSEGGGGRVGFWRALVHLLGTKAALPFYRIPRRGR
ncbi:hypothetical protein GBA63_06805 [Rubrobacter tropicus]|uniref:N-acetyltransferase domain-containing protein n=1 Tax=Rubrobacter tropicus TaxID=2653851 RepID=A0A6G8Q7G9_9ACTN|nr:hypothetical protein [Rubrobacter tropicus]QIN82392.1 hypothetical protein GBA63_06805 [Rubrobacter tropicus]